VGAGGICIFGGYFDHAVVMPLMCCIDMVDGNYLYLYIDSRE
jgi:hypothetical protein